MSEQVERMFAAIAKDYDKANRILSFGVDKAWRRAAVRAARIRQGDACLDVATGTGDLALALARRTGAKGRVVGLDFCRPMLVEAQHKAEERGASLDLVWGDALNLPFANDAFDVATIAFGVRNVDDPARCVAEMARTVRPDGRVLVLEFGQPRGIMSAPYRIYSKHVMPRLGAAITGDRAAYEYLPETASRFPSGEAFAAIMRDTGAFRVVRARSMTGGIAWLYVGTVAP
jgi:demethylmenaquinone methyltransferase / 2-methoxy-6-polyprenyl-1,4-benzoquinol methylase